MAEDALLESGLMPSEPAPVRVERFVEKRFGLTPIYDALPDGVLGYTVFGAKGRQAMRIARALAEEGTEAAERRINSTLAHEAGHCLLHGHLFALEATSTGSMFGGDVSYEKSAPKIICRDEKKTCTEMRLTP